MAIAPTAKADLLIVGKVIAAMGVIWFAISDPRPLLVDWRKVDDLSIPVRSRIELAAKWGVIKRGSLSLVCSAQGNLHLFQRARLHDDWVREVGFAAKGTMHVDLLLRDAPTRRDRAAYELQIERVDVVAVGIVDTLLTIPLSATQIVQLADLFGSSPPQNVTFWIEDVGQSFTGVADGATIRALAARCRP